MNILKVGEKVPDFKSVDQYNNTIKLSETVTINTTKRHNHSLPPMFKAGCPACEESKNNQFRDLRRMM